MEFCHPAIFKLMAFDEKHKTSYTETLFSYISTAQKKLGSANSLHVHRNTVNYRIQKIKEITGMDLSDNTFFQHCCISMKILEYTMVIKIDSANSEENLRYDRAEND